ncbi:hypothetical protein BDW02DRAFT_573686 [Decorospora gaudefroyi]|uniref:Biotrophy-associated secreted protein 2 n=1 Tax=Decorospora gaudefroyi TaxID=184978 RepID=A0A6A5JXZ0_9PLEO|nr:hypothetical protein BDW02DRAFT_573686 [Decorospora gaudefroyi]
MAPIFKLVALLNLSLYVAAQGTQFITGDCASDAECASACCGFQSGKCAAPFVANESGQGCGFGDAQPNNGGLNAMNAANNGNANADANKTATAAAPTQTSAAAAAGTGAGNGAGTQFITGPCSSDADCAAGCCGFNSGKCAGPVVAQERDGGCGFGDAQPNDNAAKALKGRRLGRRGAAYM